MKKLSDFLIEHAHPIEMKWHLLIGFILGSGPLAFLVDRWQDIVFALILGASGSIGSSLVKFWYDRLLKKKNRMLLASRKNKKKK